MKSPCLQAQPHGWAAERGAFRRSRWSQGVCGPADVAAAAAADESRVAIDSHQVGSAVPADRLGAHAISVFLKPVSPRMSRMTRMGKAARGVYGRRSASEVL